MKSQIESKSFLPGCFIILLSIVTLVIGVKYNFLAEAQLGQLGDNFFVYDCMLRDAQNASPTEIANYMRYVYTYYPAGTKYVSNEGTIAEVIEQGRIMTLTLLRLKLEEKLKIKFHNEDILTIIEKYGDESTFNKENYLDWEPIDIYKYNIDYNTKEDKNK